MGPRAGEIIFIFTANQASCFFHVVVLPWPGARQSQPSSVLFSRADWFVNPRQGGCASQPRRAPHISVFYAITASGFLREIASSAHPRSFDERQLVVHESVAND